jgi:KamA family protein
MFDTVVTPSAQVARPPAPWQDISLVQWNDFRVDVTPYFASLIDPDDPHCPVRKQVIPTDREMVPFQSMMEDSLAEDKHSPVPGLVHRYPDRVLMLITTQCASYCRYCTRSRIVGDPTQTFSRAEFDAQIDYIERTPQMRDVLLSGGDPMVLAPKLLDMILGRLRAIPHVEIIRIGSRVPVFLPMRVTPEFCDAATSTTRSGSTSTSTTPRRSRPNWPRRRPPDRRRRPAWATRACCWPGSTTPSTSSASWCTTW